MRRSCHWQRRQVVESRNLKFFNAGGERDATGIGRSEEDA
jgi:hypothetical protein